MTANLICLTNPTAPAAEAYRRLRANLLAVGREAPLQAILVVAAGIDPEKSVALANLAVSIANVGKRVVLADCDLRHPAQHAIFGLGNAAGVTTALNADSAPLPLQTTEVPGLCVLATGPQTGVPADLLASPAMTRLIARLRTEADVILFDVAPMLLATDAAELAPQVDGVLLTVRSGHTKRDEAQKAKDLLTRVGGRIVGAALT